MISHTTVRLTLDVHGGATAEELRAIERFVDIEQDRIAQHFVHVFGLVEGEVRTVPATAKPKRPKSRILKRIRKAYGL